MNGHRGHRLPGKKAVAGVLRYDSKRPVVLSIVGAVYDMESAFGEDAGPTAQEIRQTFCQNTEFSKIMTWNYAATQAMIPAQAGCIRIRT